MNHCKPPRQPHSQRGAALIWALMTVTLVTSLASVALWRQWREAEIEQAEKNRSQAAWVLVGTLDWVRSILREDAINGGQDHLGEPWAVPLREARLTRFLSAQHGVSQSDWLAQSGERAFLSGQIEDAQARLNLRNLVQNGQLSLITLKQLERLMGSLGLPPAGAQQLGVALLMAWSSPTSGQNTTLADQPIPPETLTDLSGLGIPQAWLAVLSPHVCILPSKTPVNLNTASAHVISAVVGQLDLAGAQRAVLLRQAGPFLSLSQAAKALDVPQSELNPTEHALSTRFFIARGQLRLDDLLIQEQSLLQRDGVQIKVLWRRRGIDQQPAGQLEASSAPL